jgi:hypothetical protein
MTIWNFEAILCMYLMAFWYVLMAVCYIFPPLWFNEPRKIWQARPEPGLMVVGSSPAIFLAAWNCKSPKLYMHEMHTLPGANPTGVS